MADVPVLVVSCDRYADLWRPFFELFWRRWPDFAGEIHLGSNYATYDHPRVQALRVGDDVTWAGSLMSDFMPDRIWGVKEPALVYDHAVEKGRWRPQGLEICREAGIDLDLAKRAAFTPAELQQLEQAGVASAAIARRKTDAMRLFREGRRGAGMREVL